MSTFSISPIGVIKTPFEQKLGIPRQPNLCPNIRGTISLEPSFRREDVLRSLNTFSHLWVVYIFHKSESWRETIKPPRLGGKRKVGVFASRAPHRPNQIGFSVVKLEGIKENFDIEISGVDILNNTPLIDIKPYLSLWDNVDGANNGWVDETPPLIPLDVDFSNLDKSILSQLKTEQIDILKETLCWDPRPAYIDDYSRTYTHNVENLEVTWKRGRDKIEVIKVTKKF